MFVRKKSNKSGSVSIQIIDKSTCKYRVVETIGSSKDRNKIDFLVGKAYQRISELLCQEELKLLTVNDKIILNFLKNSTSLKVRVTGPNDIYTTKIGSRSEASIWLLYTDGFHI